MYLTVQFCQETAHEMCLAAHRTVPHEFTAARVIMRFRLQASDTNVQGPFTDHAVGSPSRGSKSIGVNQRLVLFNLSTPSTFKYTH
jgi:hypothetical protein